MCKKTKTAVQYAVEKGVAQATVYRWIKLGMPHVAQETGKALRPVVMLIDAEAADAWLKERVDKRKGVQA